MKIYHKFSFDFSANQLAQELEMAQAVWIPHMNKAYYSGDWSGIPLRSPTQKIHVLSAGHPDNLDFFDEALLTRLPYTLSVLQSFKTDLLSVRYLKLAARSEIKTHRDADLIFWDGFVRLHIPVITNPEVHFTIADLRFHMDAGACWFADFSKPHHVLNNGETDRIHLVIDCVVNDWMRGLFIREGILGELETKPDPIDDFSENAKLQMIAALENMDTETSLNLAMEMRTKYQLFAQGN